MKKIFLLLTALSLAAGAWAMSSSDFKDKSKDKAEALQQAAEKFDHVVYSSAFPSNPVNDALKYTQDAFNYVQPDVLWVTQVLEIPGTPGPKTLKELKDALRDDEKVLAGNDLIYTFKTIPADKGSEYFSIVNAFNAAVEDSKKFFNEQIKILKEQIKKVEDNQKNQTEQKNYGQDPSKPAVEY